jgi:acyl-CoA hydrolase
MRQAAHPARTLTAAEAASHVQPGMSLEYGFGISQPTAFDAALAARVPSLHDIKLRACFCLRPLPSIEVDPSGERIHGLSLHFGTYERRLHEQGRYSYVPVNLGEIPDYYRRNIPPLDMVVIKARPPGPDGMLNFGPSNLWYRAMIERAQRVVIELCPSLVDAHGVANGVHLSEVDGLIEGADVPMPVLPNPAPGEVDQAVARFIAGEIEDGACLQIGIGGMPNAVCAMLAEAGLRDLGIHTEMLTDGLADLYRRGIATGARKGIDAGKVIYTFTAGSAELYRTIDGNTDMLCLPLDYTNMPHIIMQNPRAVAINSTTQVDLTGQAASESDGHRHISGTGGQAQFVRGAYASEGARRSRIVPTLTPGNTVTTTRADMQYVVTEYGIVNLKGRSTNERARLLISIAHPDFREELERAAYEQRLLPRGFSFGASCHA